MDETEDGNKLSGSEFRKQQLLVYLASKGRLKPPNPKPYLRDTLDSKQSSFKRTHLNQEKENQVPSFSTGKNGVQKTTHNSTAKAASKLKAKSVPGFQIPPLADARCLTAQVGTRIVPKLKSSGSTATAHSSDPLRDKVTKHRSSKAQQCPLSARARADPGLQSRQTYQGSASHTDGHSQADKDPFRTTKPPSVSRRHIHAASHTLKRSRVETQAKPQQVLKTVTKPNTVRANREVPLKSCVNSNPPRVTSKESKTPGQRLNSNISTNNNAVSVKPQENKAQKRPISTSVLAYVPSVVGQAAVLRPLGQGSSQVKDPSRLPTLRSGTLRETQKPTALDRKPRSSVVSKPANTAVSRTSKAPAVSTRAPQTRANAAAPRTDTQLRVATAKVSTSSLPPPKSRLSCRPATAPPAITRTVPRFKESTGPSLGPENLRTPAARSRPQTATPGTTLKSTQKNPTAAQEERLRKLQEWREAKGISYKRPPMPIQKQVRKSIAVPQHYWATMEEEDELNSLVCAVDRSLADCLQLLEEGCPLEHVRQVLSRVPMAQKFCKYWMCQARLMEQQGNFDVLPLFEEAVRVVREPVDDLRAVVFEIMKKKETLLNLGKGVTLEDEAITDEQEHVLVTPKTVSAFIRGAKGDSSVVKYKVTATPGRCRSQNHEPLRVEGQEVRFLTPVRRSVRIERSVPRYPSALQEQDLCVASFRDLLSSAANDKSPLYVYQENEALKDQVQVQLFPEEN